MFVSLVLVLLLFLLLLFSSVFHSPKNPYCLMIRRRRINPAKTLYSVIRNKETERYKVACYQRMLDWMDMIHFTLLSIPPLPFILSLNFYINQVRVVISNISFIHFLKLLFNISLIKKRLNYVSSTLIKILFILVS